MITLLLTLHRSVLLVQMLGAGYHVSNITLGKICALLYGDLMEHGILLIHAPHSHLRASKILMLSPLLYPPPLVSSLPMLDCCLLRYERHAASTTRTHPLHRSIFVNLAWNISMTIVVHRIDLHGHFSLSYVVLNLSQGFGSFLQIISTFYLCSRWIYVFSKHYYLLFFRHYWPHIAAITRKGLLMRQSANRAPIQWFVRMRR